MSAEIPRILFLCTANSCRSQMAEGWLRELAGWRLEALSAGSRPTSVNPLAVEVMAEVGVDLSAARSKSIEDYLADPPDLVISVCAAASASCPAFPGSVKRLDWPLPDPAAATGSPDEVRAAFREVRDEIRARLEEWLEGGLAGLTDE